MQESWFEWDDREWQTDAEGTVRFALVGAGWWTTEYVLPAIEATDRCETTAVVSGSADKRDRIRAEYDTVTRALDYDEFQAGVGADAYDAVYVCTPNATHLEYVAAAAEQGKAVLCEKPMEATVDRARALVDVCADHDVTLMVAYRMHTEPAVRRARELVRDGFVGDPVFVHGANSQPLLDLIPDPDQWRLNPDLTGYGSSVMDLGVYPLNTARFVLDADPVAVQATMDSAHEAFADVPDERAAFTVEFDDGTYASCTSSQHGQDHTRFEVVGTAGRIELDPAFHMETSMTVTRGETTLDVETGQVDQMEEEFEYFAAKLLAGEDVDADGEHGLVDMRAIAAIHEAAETGRTVRLD